MVRRRVLICALTPLFLLLAACSGKSSSTPPTPVVVIPTASTAATAVTSARPSSSISVPGYKDDQIVDYLVSLAFSSQIGGPRVTHKWVQPIRYGLYGEASNLERAVILETLKEVAVLTHLDMTLASAPGEENLAFYFVDQKDATKAGFTSPVNRAGYYIRSQGAVGENDIGKVGILIDTGANPTALTMSLKAMMIKGLVGRALGLINIVSTYKDSVFTGVSAQNVNLEPIIKYSDLDKKVMQLYYADSIKPGMTEQQLRTALNALR